MRLTTCQQATGTRDSRLTHKYPSLATTTAWRTKLGQQNSHRREPGGCLESLRDEPARKPGGEELLLLGATLKACPFQHLLVFLLTHALTALLNQRSHGAETIAASCDLRFKNRRFGPSYFSRTPADPGELCATPGRIFLNQLRNRSILGCTLGDGPGSTCAPIAMIPCLDVEFSCE